MDIATKCRFCKKGPLDENAVALSSSSSPTALLEEIYGVKITSNDQSACRNCVLIARIMDNKLKKLRMMASPGHEGLFQSSLMEPKREQVIESMAKAFVSMFTRGEGEEEEQELCQLLQDLSCSSTPGTPVNPATPSAPINPASAALSDNYVTPGSEQESATLRVDRTMLETFSLEEATDASANLEETAIPSVEEPCLSPLEAPFPGDSPSRGDSPSPGSHNQFLSVAGRLQTVSSVDVHDWMTELSNSDLSLKLVSLGEQPGPVNSSTKEAYLEYLAMLHAVVQPSGNRGYKGYKYELALVLNGTVAIPNLDCLEEQVCQPFRQPSVTPKKSSQKKDHFNYLLLDPMVLDGLDLVSSDLGQFRVFVESVFYVGKGKNARSLDHLKEVKNFPSKVSADKLKKVQEIWKGRGVISLHIFQHTSDEEALTREACLIDTIGLDVLTNLKRGSVYGEVCRWSLNKKRKFGVHLLHKAFWSFKADRRQEIFKSDV